MNILIYSRSQIEIGLCPRKSILISITDINSEHPRHSKYFIDVLKLKFDDVDSDKNGISMNNNHASSILSFIENYNNTINSIVVNCDAGLSRSAGVGAALSKILTGDDSHIFHFKPFLNKHCYRTLLEEYYENYNR